MPAQVARFQSVLARIGTLGVSGVSAQVLIMRPWKRPLPWRWALQILIPREPDGHLYIMAGSGLQDELIEN